MEDYSLYAIGVPGICVAVVDSDKPCCIGCWFRMPTPLEDLNAKLFREQLNSLFKVQHEPTGTIALELIDVVENDPSPKMELFSLQFRGPFRPRLDQQTHRLEHEKLGDFEIFLTPVSADQQNGTIYEAVFHRFRKP